MEGHSILFHPARARSPVTTYNASERTMRSGLIEAKPITFGRNFDNKTERADRTGFRVCVWLRTANGERLAADGDKDIDVNGDDDVALVLIAEGKTCNNVQNRN